MHTPHRLLALCLCAACAAAAAQTRRSLPPLVGRWDLTVQGPDGAYPSWLEVQRSGRTTLVGYFVGRTGSVRPISRVAFENDRLRFSLPVQWEAGGRDLSFEGTLRGERLAGEGTDSEGRRVTWSGERAPMLDRPTAPRWGAPVELFNGRDLAGWQPREGAAAHGWEERDGLLRNARPGTDLMTTRRFDDFRLHAEFRYPEGSNSGLYLRGRYEVQIEDDYGRPPESHLMGGIYGFLAPRVNAARKAGEWQSYDITLLGRRLTLTLNGETVIDRQEIPGITGGALDSREGEPGPLLLQGDHGQVEFRKLTLTPAARP